MLKLAWLVSTAIAGTAVAGAPSVPEAATPPRFAFAVSEPLGWTNATLLAASAYVGLTNHHALRGNVAAYDVDPVATFAADAFVAAVGGDPGECGKGGRVTDLGLGWMYFPRRMWNGFSVELGGLYRTRDVKAFPCMPSFDTEVHTTSFTVAGRALVGWSYVYAGRIYLSVANGISVGREFGSETSNESGTTMTSRVHRFTAAPEMFARIGFVFDL